MRRLIAITALMFALGARAADAPLTLDEVLAHADRPHPDLDAAQAQAGLARAEQLLAESLNDFRLTLEAGLRTGRNTLTDDTFEPDHLARLNASKRIWDGGRARLAGEAAGLEATGRDNQLLDTLAQRRLALMTRFFDILMTDQQYAAANEFSAVAYVNWDNGRDRHQLGELSNVQLTDLEARFQETRLIRNDLLRQAREKRALLAEAMNRPGELPSELADPVLKDGDRALPDFDLLFAAMQEGNPRLKAHRQLLAASQKRLEAVRADDGPSVDFELEGAAYSRDTYTRDNLRAGINLVWPLHQGNRVDARVAREKAQFQLLQAQYDRLLLDLRQALYETREAILHLRESERPAARVNSTLRDWNLERARAEYELELKTNLGTSMAETQRARMRSKAVEYRLALAWEKLAALLGRPVENIKEKPAS